jgi:hypothetical protein
MTASMTATMTPAKNAIAEYFVRSTLSYSTHLCDDDCAYCCGPETD